MLFPFRSRKARVPALLEVEDLCDFPIDRLCMITYLHTVYKILYLQKQNPKRYQDDEPIESENPFTKPENCSAWNRILGGRLLATSLRSDKTSKSFYVPVYILKECHLVQNIFYELIYRFPIWFIWEITCNCKL